MTPHSTIHNMRAALKNTMLAALLLLSVPPGTVAQEQNIEQQDIPTPYVMLASPILIKINPACYVLGDSIAQGIGSFSNHCQTIAKQGINSSDYFKYLAQSPLGVAEIQARSVVISLGVNDGESVQTHQNLTRLRSRIKSASVTWIISPLARQQRKAELTRLVAREFGDTTIEVPHDILSPDNLHPTGKGYQMLSSMALLYNSKNN